MIKTNKKINLVQLDKELGGFGLIADFNDSDNKIIGVASNSPVTDEELNAAIEKHIAQPTEQELEELNRNAGIAKLKELGLTQEQIEALLA